MTHGSSLIVSASFRLKAYIHTFHCNCNFIISYVGVKIQSMSLHGTCDEIVGLDQNKYSYLAGYCTIKVRSSVSKKPPLQPLRSAVIQIEFTCKECCLDFLYRGRMILNVFYPLATNNCDPFQPEHSLLLIMYRQKGIQQHAVIHFALCLHRNTLVVVSKKNWKLQ
jgi:hypothetical protein